MATILVDYENVQGTKGLKGVEYLAENDHLIVFYSTSCMKITAEYMDPIKESGCKFSIYKLKKPSKNALDFYMATEAGIAYQKGERDIILVSGDKGFNSVHDYFVISEFAAHLILAPTIEDGLLKLSGHKDKKRRELLAKKSEKMSLSAEFARIDERKRFKESIAECLAGTEYEEDVPRILSYLARVDTSSKRDFYRSSLHEFGRESGTVIYNMLKNVV